MTDTNANTPNIYQRLHAVMEEVEYIQKEKKNGMNYTIVSHDAVTAKVRPVLVKHRVIYYPVKIERTQDGNRTQMDVTVRFVNIDQPADFIDVACCGYGIDPQDKGPGKATSYAVKYALLKALGLETGDDPDQDDIPHDRGKPPATSKPPRYQEPAQPPAAGNDDPRAIADRIKHGMDAASTLDALNAFMRDAGFRPGSDLPATGSDLAKVRQNSAQAYKFLIDRADNHRSKFVPAAAE